MTSTISSTSSAQPSPTTCSVTFVVNRPTQFGETIRLVGSISQLGFWDTANSLALSSSNYTTANPIWYLTVALPYGTAQYKYLSTANGMTTYECCANRVLDTTACQANGGSVTEQDSWQYQATTTTSTYDSQCGNL